MSVISDFCDVRIGQSAPQAESAFSQTGTPFVRAGSLEMLLAGEPLSSLEQIDEASAKQHRMKLFPKGCVLFPKSGMSAKLGRVYKLEEQAHVVSHLAAVIAGNEVDENYLYHWWRNKNPASLISNDSYPSIKKTQIEAVHFSPPKLAEQKRIAAILDQADTLRRKRQQALDHLNQLGQSIFYEMFGDKSLDGKWRYNDATLINFCDKITDGTHQSPTWSQDGIPFLFSSNIRDQKINFETKKFINEDTYRELTRHSPVEEGDVLYTAVGSYGHSAVVDKKERFLFQRHIAHLKPDLSRIHPTFLSHVLESVALRRHADRVAKGVAQKTVTLSEIKQFSIPDAPLLNQQQFADRIETVESLRSELECLLDKTIDLFASLQQRAFRGEL